MIQNPRIEAVVKELGKIVVVEYRPIHEAVQMIGRKDLITFRDLAYAQLKEGEFTSLVNERGWTREGVIYIPKGPVLLTSESFLLDDLESAIRDYRDNPRRKTSLTEEQAREYLSLAQEEKKKPAEEREIFILDRENIPRDGGLFYIPFNVPSYKPNINQEEFLSWLLKDQKSEWRSFMKNSQQLRETNRTGIGIFVDKLDNIDGRFKTGAKPYVVQVQYGGIGDIYLSWGFFNSIGTRTRVVDKE